MLERYAALNRRDAMAGVAAAPEEAPQGLSRLSLNQATTQRWSLRETVDGCVRSGVTCIALRRESVAKTGLARAARIVSEAALSVSSLHVGGLFPATTAGRRRARRRDNLRAVEEAATLGAAVLALSAGPPAGLSLDEARGMVADGIEELIPVAEQHGVKLGVEPLHPVWAAERSVLVTLGEANRLLDRLDSPVVGLTVDAYHVWWDPDLYAEIARSTGRIVGFHVDDWPLPNTYPLMSRALMGDGVIDLRRIRAAVDQAGYAGPIEVEIFNPAVWSLPGDQILRVVRERFLRHVL